MNPSDYAHLFATPYKGSATQIAQVLSSAYLQVVHRRVMKLADRILQKKWHLPMPTELAVHAWRPECGLALQATQNNYAEAALLQLGAAYAAMGSEVDISILVKDRLRLFFSGHLFEVLGETQLVATHHSVKVYTNDARSCIVFTCTDDAAWKIDCQKCVHPVLNWMPLQEAKEHGINDCGYVVQSSDALPQNSLRAWPEHDETYPVLLEGEWQSPKAGGGRIRAAQSLIREHAPGYAEWNSRLSSGFLLYSGSDSAYMRSESSGYRPGLISLDKEGGTPLSVGELLVHENAHQHMFLYGMLAPFTNDNDRKLYYSPLKRMERPIDRILLAAHATANILLYYDELRSNGARLENWYLDNMRFHLEGFNQMRAPLSKSIGLTAVGHLFFDEITSVLDQRDFSWVV